MPTDDAAVASGEHDHRQMAARRLTPDVFADGKAVHIREMNIEKGQIDFVLLECLYGIGTALRHHDIKAFVTQTGAEGFPPTMVIIGDENTRELSVHG